MQPAMLLLLFRHLHFFVIVSDQPQPPRLHLETKQYYTYADPLRVTVYGQEGEQVLSAVVPIGGTLDRQLPAPARPLYLVQADPGMSVFEAAKANNIMIPHLCYLEDVHQIGACRICVVEIEGARTLQASCMVPVREGMVVRTNTARVKHARKVLYELMLSDHPRDCLSCLRNQNCEFQRLGELIQIPEFRFEGERSKTFVDLSSPSIVRDSSKCILCRRCVTVCNEVQEVGVLNVQKRGFHTIIGPADELPLAGVSCTNCGQCVMVCPVGALLAQDATERTWQAIFDPNKRVVVQTAPAVRVALGEEFGYPPGTIVTGKMASALREIGFDARQLAGGYKAFRARVNAELPQLAQRFRYVTICGCTGTGKTALLAALTDAGAQVIDLEGLANHRGSLLGARDTPQPTQKHFDTLLWNALRTLDPARPVFIESESKKIGLVQMPDAMREKMGAGECVWLDVPLPARVAHIAAEYAHFVADPQALMERLQPLKTLRGAKQLQAWQVMADRRDTDALFASLMVDHYDPLYTTAIERNYPQLAAAHRVELAALNAASLAAAASGLRQRFDPV